MHLLPAPVFRVTAHIQARRRLGLTATLIREDGREGDVFSLIGPKKYDVPWRELESRGLDRRGQLHRGARRPARRRCAWNTPSPSGATSIASPARIPPRKTSSPGCSSSTPASRCSSSASISSSFAISRNASTSRSSPARPPNTEREDLYGKFRRGEIRQLILSKVGNFAIDLPDANVLIQVSGTFGSRQEEAQRLGRILRPKANGETAHFYTLVTRDTRELDFAHHRQMFLTEQGYSYNILDGAELAAGGETKSEGRRGRDPMMEKGHVRIPVKLHRKVALIQTEDALLAEELLAHKKLSGDIVGRLADCVLLVRAGRVEAVVQELRRMGHTPQVL